MSTRYIVLGLLAQQPMSGYDIRSLFKGLSWMIGSPSYGSLYPTLHTLHEETLVEVTVQPSEGRPSRKLYTITEAGRRSLQSWLQGPSTPELSTKDFARRLIVVGNTSSDELRGYLECRRGQLAAYLGSTDSGTAAADDSGKTDPGQHLIRDYGLAIAKAETAWLNERLAELSKPPSTTAATEDYESRQSSADA